MNKKLIIIISIAAVILIGAGIIIWFFMFSKTDLEEVVGSFSRPKEEKVSIDRLRVNISEFNFNISPMDSIEIDSLDLDVEFFGQLAEDILVDTNVGAGDLDLKLESPSPELIAPQYNVSQ